MQRNREYIDELSNRVLGAAFEVHSALGPGLLETAYESCLCKELELRGIPYRRQVHQPVHYKGLEIDAGYRIDVLVDGCLLIELKSCEKLVPQFKAQTMTYLKLSGIWLGLLINFNETHLRDGIVRIVNGNPP